MDEGAETMEAVAEDSVDDLLGGMDDLMPDVAEDVGEPMAEVMDEMVDEAMDDVADEATDSVDDLLGGIEDAAAMDEPDLSIDDLFDGAEEAATQIEEVMDEPVAEIVEMVEEPEVPEAVVEMAEPVVEVAEPVMEEAAADVVDDLVKEAQAVSNAEIVRMRAREMDGLERVKEGFDAMSDQDYEAARSLFDEAIRLIPERDSTRSTIQSARWGHSDASVEIAKVLLEARNAAGASAALEQALEYNPDNRSVSRLKKKVDRLVDVRTPVRKRESTIAQRDQIRDLLIEGRDLFENKMYNESETVFDQVRLLDEYNITAMQFLKRIEDRRYKLNNIERERSVARMVQEVRDKWNPPLRKDIERPELEKDQPEVGTGDAIEDRLLQKMKDLVIPSIEFRNANIIDVVEELRKESERADPEKEGINIVLKLSGGSAAAAPSDLGLLPDSPTSSFGGSEDFGGFEEDFGSGGFDDFSGFEEQSFDSPAQAQSGGGGEFAVPKITLTLRKISLYDALKIITEYADLKFKIENRIIFITPKSQITEPLETRVYAVQPSLIDVVVESEEEEDSGSRDEFVEMGKAATFRRIDVKQFFQAAGVPFPPGTTITYNAATSQLIVRNTQDNLEVFERILPNFNLPPTQVEIEARFVEILQEDLEELGVEWILTDNYEIARNTEDGILGGAERVQLDADERGLTQGLRFLNSGAAGTEPGGRSALDEIGFLGDILSFSSVLTNPEMKVILHALNQRGGTDLLSAPRITTRSGITASIEVVQEIIYPTEFEAESASSRIDVQSTGDNEVNVPTGVVIFPETFETREVGVILNVTPTVGPDKYTIDLSLAPEVAELVSWIQYGTPPFNIPQPIFASRNATTSIVIWDGQTVVMGGLISEQLVRFEDKVPFLGDLPFIGALFRSKGESSVKRNLLIFVTARIVDPAGQAVNKEKAIASSIFMPSLNGSSNP